MDRKRHNFDIGFDDEEAIEEYPRFAYRAPKIKGIRVVKFNFVLLFTLVALTFGASALELSTREAQACTVSVLCK
jgi:hypothetical protein